jgi:hypothetical protein
MVLLMKPWAAFDMADYKDANGAWPWRRPCLKPGREVNPSNRAPARQPVAAASHCHPRASRASPAGNGVLVNDVLQVFIGGGVFMTALPLAFAAFAANASQDPAAGAAVALKGPSSSIDSVTDSTRRPFRAVLMLLLLCVSQRSAFTLQPAYTHAHVVLTQMDGGADLSVG